MAKSIGQEIDELQELREEVRKATKILDALKEQKSAKEAVILEMLKVADIDRASGTKATVSISETVVGQLVDMDKLWRYVKKNNAVELFERRISSTAFREHLEQRKGKPVPGTEKFVRRVLNMRNRDSN